MTIEDMREKNPETRKNKLCGQISVVTSVLKVKQFSLIFNLLICIEKRTYCAIFPHIFVHGNLLYLQSPFGIDDS